MMTSRTDQALAPGTKLRAGHYRLTGVLGAGGFGIVYRAQVKGGKTVAIKELFPEGAHRRGFLGWRSKRVVLTSQHQELIKLARDEFRTVRPLKHPHIVRAIELFGENGTLYLVMEFLDGPTLHDELVKHPDGLPESQALPIAQALARALAHAHTKGVLHRDVKPGNVILTKSGRPVLFDFGLARVWDAGHTPRCHSGTDAYMSPEQCQGEAQTAATDVYSLAATIYHLLTGAPPPSAKDRLADDRLTPVLSEHPAVLPELAHALDAALVLDPARRTPSCAHFLANLRGIDSAMPAVAKPSEPLWGLARGLLVVAALAVAAGLLKLLVF